MLTADLTSESLWSTGNGGLEYTASAPVMRPPLLDDAVTVLVTCEKQPFTSAERALANRRVQMLHEQLTSVIDRLMAFLHETDLERFHARTSNPTLLLRSGNPDWCAFCMDLTDGGQAVFVEWFADSIVSVWQGE